MYYTIYKVTNKINGKFYIGCHKTCDLDDNYMGSGKYLKRAQEKYGIEHFEKDILHVFDNPDDMFSKEAEIVNEDFLAEENTYNLKLGGFGGWDYTNSSGRNLYYDESGKCLNANPHNLLYGDDLKERMKEKGTYNDWKKKCTNVIRKYISENGNPFEGKFHTEESKRKIGKANSEKQKGKKNSQFGTRWIHSLEEKRSKKISKNDSLPSGWNEGRKIKF